MGPVTAFTTALVVMWFQAASTESTGGVSGTLEVGGKTITLDHVLVIRHDNEEGMLDGPELRLLFTDTAIDPVLLGSPLLSTLDALAREGDLRGVLLRFDPTVTPRKVHGAIYHTPLPPQSSMLSFSIATENGGFQSLDVDRVQGTAEHRGTGEGKGDQSVPFAYKVTFDAPIRRNAPVTARLKGEEAQKSPQAEAVLAFERSMRAGDIQASRKYATARRNKEVDGIVAVMGKDFLLNQARLYIPEDAVRRKQVVEVVERGDHAIVIFVNDGAREPAPVVKIRNQWFVE